MLADGAEPGLDAVPSTPALELPAEELKNSLPLSAMMERGFARALLIARPRKEQTSTDVGRIPAGETSFEMTIIVAEDVDQEGDETAIVTLGNPAGGILGTAPHFTLTILDDD